MCMRNVRGCVLCVQVEETEKEREERLKQWENFLEEGEEDKGKEKGESDSIGHNQQTNSTRSALSLIHCYSI